MTIQYSSLLTKSIFILLLVASFMLSGCSTTEKFKIYAPEGTAFYTPTRNEIGKVSSGVLNVEFPSDAYYGYVMTYLPDSDIMAPFGLNVHKKVRYGEKIAIGAGCLFAGAGLGTTLTGTIGLIAGAGEPFGVITGVGLGLTTLGVSAGMPASSRLSQLTHDYNFTYDSRQVVSLEGLSSELIHLDPVKESLDSEIITKKRNKASSGESSNGKTTNSSAARKTGNNTAAKRVAGTYTGHGQLLYDGDIDEEYGQISLVIEAAGKNTVNVRVVESDEDFFISPLKFNVTVQKNGAYLLKLENMPSVTIKIDKRGNAKFSHNKVNIDGVIYTLNIEASKK